MNGHIGLIHSILPATVDLSVTIPETHPSARNLGSERVGSGTIVDSDGYPFSDDQETGDPLDGLHLTAEERDRVPAPLRGGGLMRYPTHAAVTATTVDAGGPLQGPVALLLVTGTLIGLNLPLGKIAGDAGVSPLTWALLISLGASGVLLPVLLAGGRLTLPTPTCINAA